MTWYINLKTIIEKKTDFFISLFSNIHDKRVGYNLNVMRASIYLVNNSITDSDFADLFNCTPLNWASYYITALT